MTKPVVFIGMISDAEYVATIERCGFGIMFVDAVPRLLYPGMPWAVDNGCFGAWKNGRKWTTKVWKRRMDKWARWRMDTPMLAVVPDLPTRGEESLEFSDAHAPLMPKRFPKALALQDGMTFKSVESRLDTYEWLFIGGSDEFKTHADEWLRFARDNGKKIHFGRASTIERLEWVMHLGFDSLDTSAPLWTRERFRRYVDVYENGHPNGVLFQR